MVLKSSEFVFFTKSFDIEGIKEATVVGIIFKYTESHQGHENLIVKSIPSLTAQLLLHSGILPPQSSHLRCQHGSVGEVFASGWRT